MKKPNVILILVDDMGYGDFGVFGDGTPKTPILDKLVLESICLTQHYSASPVCAPARAALMTGRYPHRTGVIDTLEGRGLDRLSLDEVTMADLFKSAGYSTGIVGKWHLGALDPRYSPNNRGFDEFIGFRGGWSDYYKWRLDYNGGKKESDGRYLTDVFTNEAVDFIKRHSKDNFFLHVAYNAPHFPFQVPYEELKPFLDNDKITKGTALIYAMIKRMDEGLGAILDELKKQGIEDNTLLLFTSDNGPQFGGKGEMCTTRYNIGLRGEKCLVYEGGIKVPAVLRWPEELQGGCMLNNMVHFTDWFPTLLFAAGIEVPYHLNIDGENVLPILKGEKVEKEKRFWQWNRYTPIGTCNAAMREGKWKLVRPVIKQAMQVSAFDQELDERLKYQPETVADIYRGLEPERQIPLPPKPQLFDIENDPEEIEDLVDIFPDRAADMLKELEAWFKEVENDRKRI